MPSKSNLVFAAVVFVVLGGIAAAYINVISGGGTSPAVVANSGDAKVVALGKTVYASNCAACHGVNLKGQPNWRVKKANGVLPAPPHDATGHTWHHTDQMLFSVVKLGGQANAPKSFISGMPAFGKKLSDNEIVAALAYIKSRWPENIRKRQAQLSRNASGQ